MTFWKGKPIGTENKSEAAGGGERDWLITKGHDKFKKKFFKEHDGILGGDGAALDLHCGGGYMTICNCQNSILPSGGWILLYINYPLILKIKEQIKSNRLWNEWYYCKPKTMILGIFIVFPINSKDNHWFILSVSCDLKKS